MNATRLFNKLYDEVVYQPNWNNEVAQIEVTWLHSYMISHLVFSMYITI